MSYLLVTFNIVVVATRKVSSCHQLHYNFYLFFLSLELTKTESTACCVTKKPESKKKQVFLYGNLHHIMTITCFSLLNSNFYLDFALCMSL